MYVFGEFKKIWIRMEIFGSVCAVYLWLCVCRGHEVFYYNEMMLELDHDKVLALINKAYLLAEKSS